MSESVTITHTTHAPFKYEPLPGEEQFFIDLWGGGDKDAYHAFCMEIMFGREETAA